MLALNDAVGILVGVIGTLVTCITTLTISQKYKAVAGWVGIIVTIAISVSAFCFMPNDKTVKDAIYNIFNNNYSTSDIDMDKEPKELSKPYSNYSVYLAFREKVMYTVPLNDNKNDKAYEVYRDIKIKDLNEISLTSSVSNDVLKYSLSKNGHLIFDCNSIPNGSTVVISYKNKAATCTFNALEESPVKYCKVTKFDTLEQHEYLFKIKDSADHSLSNSTIYLLCEEHEIPLSIDETGTIKSYLFLSDGQYEFYTKNDDGSIAEHSVITIPSEGLNETNTIVLK